MDVFPILRRKAKEKHREYQTRRVILEIYDAMQDAIRTGETDETCLDSRPGPSIDGLPDWPFGRSRREIWSSHIYPLRDRV